MVRWFRSRRRVEDGPVPWRRSLAAALLLPIGLAADWAARRTPEIADAFSGFFYPLISRALGAATGWIPFSLFELLLASVVLTVVLRVSRNVHLLIVRRRRPHKVALRALLSLLALAGILYGGGVLLWGLAYHRSSFADRAGWDARPATAEELGTLSLELVEATNAARNEVEEDGTGVMLLDGTQRRALARGRLGFDRARQLQEILEPGYAGRAKGFSLLSAGMTRLGLSGIFIPYTSEPTVNLELPDPALPFTACHEIAHQMGFAREEEANLVGYLGCTAHPDPEFRYSGYLAALDYALRALEREDAGAYRTVVEHLSAAVVRDRVAVQTFWARRHSVATRVGQRVNDLYLKSQGQTAGVRSYGRMVDLLIAERRARKAAAASL